MRTQTIAAIVSALLVAGLCWFASIGALVADGNNVRREATEQAGASATQQAKVSANQFYSGMYALCIEAFESSGFPIAEVVKACNDHVSEQRDLQAHLKITEGYQP